MTRTPVLLILLLLSFVVYFTTAKVSTAQDAKGIHIPGNGVLNPSKHYQRYRYKEYSQNKPYYQWWYYYVQDLAKNKHYAFTYGMTTCSGVPSPACTYTGAYVLFAEIDNTQKTRMQKYEFYPLSHLLVSDEFNYKVYGSNVSEALKNKEAPLFELKPLNDDTFQITGDMRKNSPFAWVSEDCDLNMEVKWNVTLSRVYGYYAQDVFEKPDELLRGIIMWDTYAHNSLIHNGQIIVNGESSILDHNSDPTKVRFRGYGDGNWGQLMPSNPKHPENKDFAWGWYLTKVPNSDPSKDVSVIAGVGKTYTAFPFYTMDGKFADVRINSSLHIEFRVVVVYGQVLTSCNDGQLIQFNVDRDDWIDIKDNFGVAKIPLSQRVTLESLNYIIVQDCKSVETNYNRLLFAFEKGVFSDFEGLGVSCRLTITYKPTKQVIVDQSDIQSGIEYGFNYDIHNIPPLPTAK